MIPFQLYRAIIETPLTKLIIYKRETLISLNNTL